MGICARNIWDSAIKRHHVLIINVSIKSVQVDGISMYPTLHNSQFVIVDKLAYVFSNPQRGDIIVLNIPWTIL